MSITAVRPQDDLYRYVNGKWLAATEMPADKAQYGAFIVLRDESELRSRRSIIETVAKAAALPGDKEGAENSRSLQQLHGRARLEQLGAKPLDTEFARIDAIKSTRGTLRL